MYSPLFALGVSIDGTVCLAHPQQQEAIEYLHQGLGNRLPMSAASDPEVHGELGRREGLRAMRNYRETA